MKRLIDVQQQFEEAERPKVPIHRKPLPSVPFANYPPSERPLPPPKSYPSYQPGIENRKNATQSERFAARGSHLKFDHHSESQHQVVRQSPQRILPRSGHSDQYSQYPSEYSTSTEDVSNQPSISHRNAYGSGPGSPQPQFSTFDEWQKENVTSLDHKPEVRQPINSHGATQEHLHKQVTITLIRRDPVSGSQWNIGTISVGESGISHTPLRPVRIEINTPGYTRFPATADLQRPGTGYSTADSIKEALASGKLSNVDNGGHDENRCTFNRVAGYSQQFLDSRTLKLHRRTNSSNSVTKPGSPGKQPRQVYSFMSPWQGLCTFVNSIDGRSLRCRHTLSSSTFTEEDTTINVAELRFNLPWFVLPNSGEKEPEDRKLPISELLGPRSGKEALKRKIQHFRNKSSDKADTRNEKLSSEEYIRPTEPASQPMLVSEMDRLSLKLGREKAGGGFKGTSAKLGKLIIEDEGLKMCDLVVSACMGVWWQHYEGRDD